MLPQQDIQLIARLKNNDAAAFDELYLHYFKMLCATAYFFLKNESEAKDLVQTLFMDIWERKLYEQFHQDVKGHLFRAVKNRCLNFIKAQKTKEGRMADIQLYLEATAPEEVPDEETPACHEKLQALLSDMKGQKKAALTMVYFNNKKYSEAAGEMGIGINSLKTHLKSALKTLRVAMTEKK